MDWKIELTKEQQGILNGQAGVARAKAMNALVRYGCAMGARHLVPVTGAGHIASGAGVTDLAPCMNLLRELKGAGVTARYPFTVGPRPIDENNLPGSFGARVREGVRFGDQKKYEKLLRALGMTNKRAFTCGCFTAVQGEPIPEYGAVLSWGGSAAVVCANSLCGARTNRNPPVIDLLGNLMGFVPEFGLLTDEGRKARLVIDLKLRDLPEPQLLGEAIGAAANGRVVYLNNLSGHFAGETVDHARAYLKEMGAAAASRGVALFHADGMTPEAMQQGFLLIAPDAERIELDETAITKARGALGESAVNRKPKLVLIGCPQLDEHQLFRFTEKLVRVMCDRRVPRVKVKTVICGTQDGLSNFVKTAHAKRLRQTGVRISAVCPYLYLSVGRRGPVVTDSAQLARRAGALWLPEDALLELLVKGKQ